MKRTSRPGQAIKFWTELRKTKGIMDKKTKKRVEILRARLDKTRKLLVFANQQPDEPDEVQNLKAEIERIQAEIESLKKS